MNTLTYTMTVTPANPKLNFDGTTLSASYLDNDYTGVHICSFICSDGVLQDEFEFEVNFMADEAPLILNPTTTLAGTINIPFSFYLSYNYFTDPDGDDTDLPFFIGPIDGEIWPSFMVYDPEFRRITGFTTNEADKKSWSIKVWTYDDVSTVEHTFAITFGSCYYRCETCFGE